MTINYDFLLDKANRFLVKEALKLTDDNCNIYISFFTYKGGIDISSKLHKKYPEKMSIVLQHQFSDLVVNDSYFSVELSFGNVLEKIKVAFSVIEVFHDRNVNFYLKLGEYDNEDPFPSFEEKFDEESKIVSIDKFLKR